MNSLPTIRIQKSSLIERRFGILAMNEKRIQTLRREWEKCNDRVLKILQNITDLTFAQNIIDVYILDPGAVGGCSNPIIIGGGVKKKRFAFLLAHELTHRLMYDNNHSVNWHIIARKKWQKESHLTAHHIAVNAVLDLAFKELNKTSDIDLDKKISKKSAEYARAWQIVDKEGAHNIIQKIKNGE